MRKTYLVIAGSLLIAAGLAMLALPGPGVVVIALGLTVLASAGVLWAAKLLVRARERLPDPEEEADDTGLVGTAVSHIDDRMENMEAVEVVKEQDRKAREKAHREDLVTSDREYVEGGQAAQELRARDIADAADHRLF